MKATQGRRLIAALKRKPMTSMELQMMGVSTCWWKRVSESLQEDEKLLDHWRKTVNGKTIKVYGVVKAS
jgi:predicted transcriptional regulator